MKILPLLILVAIFVSCNKTEKNYHCGVNPELNVEFDGGFVALANVFSPDGDGVDEAFGPVSYGLASMRMVVYDKEDNVAFESSDLSKWWDGRIKDAVTPGSYRYSLEVKTLKGETISKTGQVCVIKEGTKFCYQSFENFKFISLYSKGVFSSPEVYREKYNKCD